VKEDKIDLFVTATYNLLIKKKNRTSHTTNFGSAFDQTIFRRLQMLLSLNTVTRLFAKKPKRVPQNNNAKFTSKNAYSVIWNATPNST